VKQCSHRYILLRCQVSLPALPFRGVFRCVFSDEFGAFCRGLFTCFIPDGSAPVVSNELPRGFFIVRQRVGAFAQTRIIYQYLFYG
jgi:hypothetical protein